jgi:hypothetical protein
MDWPVHPQIGRGTNKVYSRQQKDTTRLSRGQQRQLLVALASKFGRWILSTVWRIFVMSFVET